ncbi:MAG: hypothetical protein ACRCV5_16810 [Afipia sp.]
MTIYAEHVIGLRAVELARQDDPETAVSVRLRFEQIRASGVLLPRVEPKPVGEDGSVFDFDRIAGDNQYVFLSHGARYRNLRKPSLCYGFVFDAQQLIHECGALVGPDMLEVYEDLLDKIVQDIDGSLPPLTAVSDEELSEFACLFGEHDPEMLAYIQQQSTSRYWDIFDAVRDGDFSVEGAEEALNRFLQQSAQLRGIMRRSGDEAIAALREMEMQAEILAPNSLLLKHAVGTIEAGEIYLL